jgi:hypothetical protein
MVSLIISKYLFIAKKKPQKIWVSRKIFLSRKKVSNLPGIEFVMFFTHLQRKKGKIKTINN